MKENLDKLSKQSLLVLINDFNSLHNNLLERFYTINKHTNRYNIKNDELYLPYTQKGKEVYIDTSPLKGKNVHYKDDYLYGNIFADSMSIKVNYSFNDNYDDDDDDFYDELFDED